MVRIPPFRCAESEWAKYTHGAITSNDCRGAETSRAVSRARDAGLKRP
jgi:hypothetical protein